MCENCNYLFKDKFSHTIKFDTIIILRNCLYHIDDIDYLFTVFHAYTGTLGIWY